MLLHGGDWDIGRIRKVRVSDSAFNKIMGYVEPESTATGITLVAISCAGILLQTRAENTTGVLRLLDCFTNNAIADFALEAIAQFRRSIPEDHTVTLDLQVSIDGLRVDVNKAIQNALEYNRFYLGRAQELSLRLDMGMPVKPDVAFSVFAETGLRLPTTRKVLNAAMNAERLGNHGLAVRMLADFLETNADRNLNTPGLVAWYPHLERVARELVQLCERIPDEELTGIRRDVEESSPALKSIPSIEQTIKRRLAGIGNEKEELVNIVKRTNYPDEVEVLTLAKIWTLEKLRVSLTKAREAVSGLELRLQKRELQDEITQKLIPLLRQISVGERSLGPGTTAPPVNPAAKRTQPH